jgi:2-polyprenyl-3-methyl-5-hydroxy-6-metoxy-1,4-benzoquinol methylase
MTGQRSLRVLDIATGAGDVPVTLWKKARKNGLFLEVDGCDKSPHAIDCARKQAQRSGAQVRFYPLDIAQEEIPAGYDIIVSSLFFHHLENGEAVGLLKRMAQAAKQMVLVNDLVRCTSGLLLAYAGTRFLSRSRIVHIDGLRSVRAAFTVEEIRKMAQEAGLKAADVERRWPSRFLLTWKK